MRRCNLWRVTTQQVEAKLKACPKLQPTHVAITDISGGCGSFYRVEVESPAFADQPLVQQHRLVHATLKKEIAEGVARVISVRPWSSSLFE